MDILVANSGSSSLKLRLVDAGERIAATADLPRPPTHSTSSRYGHSSADANPVEAIGHRIVHGGHEFTEPVLLDRLGVERLARWGISRHSTTGLRCGSSKPS